MRNPFIISATIFVGLLGWTSALDELKPGDRLCRFYSNLTKTCQSQCSHLTPSNVDLIMLARGKERVTVSAQEISDPNIDPILFIKCTDTPTVSGWTAAQEFLAFTAKSENPGYARAGVYVGACLLQNDAVHSWNCRGCDRPLMTDDNKPVSPLSMGCFIGGEDGYKGFYKSGWQQNGTDAGSLTLTHAAKNE